MAKRRVYQFFGLAMIGGILGSGVFWYSSNEPEIVPLETVRVTIPEGFNVSQIAGVFAQKGMFKAEAFLDAASGEEGYLFPDTYDFYKETTPEKVIAKMKENFDLKIEDRINGKNLHDVVIMASILEKEAASAKDWKIISGILWKRLEAKMPLQVDATLTYVTGKTSAELTEEDLESLNPYNTYEFLGLPPGPISNPGIEAIDAAINPEDSLYWFYLSDKNGEIHYAKTFEEHKLNRAKYLR